jgi:hypothetical protein
MTSCTRLWSFHGHCFTVSLRSKVHKQPHFSRLAVTITMASPSGYPHHLQSHPPGWDPRSHNDQDYQHHVHFAHPSDKSESYPGTSQYESNAPNHRHQTTPEHSRLQPGNRGREFVHTSSFDSSASFSPPQVVGSIIQQNQSVQRNPSMMPSPNSQHASGYEYPYGVQYNPHYPYPVPSHPPPYSFYPPYPPHDPWPGPPNYSNLEYVTDLGPLDVLSGRGGATNSFSGLFLSSKITLGFFCF